MTLHEKLWRENISIAEACYRHRFIQGLQTGTLPRDAFRRYVSQDAFFLQAFARAYALALAKTEDADALDTFTDLIQGVREELRLHAAYAQQLKLDLTGVQPSAAALRYTQFLSKTAWERPLGVILAAVSPCMSLYAYLAGRIANSREYRSARDDPHPYQRWVAEYTSEGFLSLVRRAEALLDRYADESAEVRGAYAQAMNLEWEFFEDALPVGEPLLGGQPSA